jgi:diacylglycerol O-acyltransferase
VRQLTSLDATFLAIEDGRSYGHVAALGIYDPSSAPGGELTLDALLALLTERLPLIPPFRWKLAPVPLGLDHPYWVDDPDFDVEYHVRAIALPAPGDDRQLADQVARLHARQLDRAHPLWELYLITGLQDGRVATFTKVHHAAVDGLSGGEILVAMLDQTPQGRPAPTLALSTPGPVPGPLRMLARGLVGLPRQPLRALRSLPQVLANLDANPIFRTIPLARQVAATARQLPGLGDRDVLEMPKTKAPRTIFNQPLTAHRRVSWASLPLADVKKVKNHFGVTVNDVVVTVCAAAVRSVLASLGELPEEALVAMVPLSVRTPEQAGTYGNRVSAMLVPIPTHLDDPGQRLAFAHETLATAKTRHSAMPADTLVDTSALLPAALATRASQLALSLLTRLPVEPPLNLVISNVPGPPVPLYCGGATLLHYYPISAVAQSVGLNLTVFSYLDGVDVGIVVDRAQLDDAWPLAEATATALAELVSLVG